MDKKINIVKNFTDRADYINSNVLDNSKIMTETTYAPVLNIREGIIMTISEGNNEK